MGMSQGNDTELYLEVLSHRHPLDTQREGEQAGGNAKSTTVRNLEAINTRARTLLIKRAKTSER